MHSLKTLIEAAKKDGLSVYVPADPLNGRAACAYFADGTGIACVQGERQAGHARVLSMIHAGAERARREANGQQ